jgi:hypothetical protein
MASIEILTDSIELKKISDLEYFSETYKDYISNSKLSLLNPKEGGSLEKFKQGIVNDYSSSLDLGSAIHGMVLQPDEYEIAETRKPGGKIGNFTECTLKYRKQGMTLKESFEKASGEANYYSGKLTPNRLKSAISKSLNYYLAKLHEEPTDKQLIYLAEGSMEEKFDSCIKSLRSNSKIKNLLNPLMEFSEPEIYNEYGIFCSMKITLDDGRSIIVPFKAKLDNFSINHDSETVTLNDLKTTGKPGSYFMGNNVKFPENEELVWIDGSFQKYHYFRQLGVYLWLLQSVIVISYGIVGYKYKTNIIAVETIPDFKSLVYAIHQGYINMGLKEFKDIMILFAQYKLDNEL